MNIFEIRVKHVIIVSETSQILELLQNIYPITPLIV
jgi:hypothetical protein